MSADTVARWCREGRVPGAMQIDAAWLIPANITLEDVERPRIGRPAVDNKKADK